MAGEKVEVGPSANCYGCHPPKWDPATCKCPECNRREAPCFMHGGKTGFPPNPDNIGEHAVDLHRALDAARERAEEAERERDGAQAAGRYFAEEVPKAVARWRERAESAESSLSEAVALLGEASAGLMDLAPSSNFARELSARIDTFLAVRKGGVE